MNKFLKFEANNFFGFESAFSRFKTTELRTLFLEANWNTD